MCASQVGPGVYEFTAEDIRPEALLFEYVLAQADGGGEAFYCICQDIAEVAATCAEIVRAHLEIGALDPEAYVDYLKSGVFKTASPRPGPDGEPIPPPPDEQLLELWLEHQADRLMALHLAYSRLPKPATLAEVVDIIQAYNFGDVGWIERLGDYVEDSQDYLLDRLAALREARGAEAPKTSLALPGDELALAELFTALNSRD